MDENSNNDNEEEKTNSDINKTVIDLCDDSDKNKEDDAENDDDYHNKEGCEKRSAQDSSNDILITIKED
eukprot:10466705-Ditylum_brightwellii.AAC.1